MILGVYKIEFHIIAVTLQDSEWVRSFLSNDQCYVVERISRILGMASIQLEGSAAMAQT